MSARILVVDDLEPNVKLLEAKLSAEYFGVLTALNGEDALEIAHAEKPDVILLDVMMPGIDGFEICRRLKADPATSHIPVIMVTALDQQSDLVAGLEAGADDFLSKPVDDIALFARVKNLARLKMMTDELRLRDETVEELGVAANAANELEMIQGCNILVIDQDGSSSEKIESVLKDEQRVCAMDDPAAAMDLARTGDIDLFIVSFMLDAEDPLRLCSQIRSHDQSRHTPILSVMQPNDNKRLIRALDIGVNDYLTRPIDGNELRARVRTQLRWKRYTERLRQNFHQSLEMAVTDQLTGLYNRRYLANHLKAMSEKMKDTKRSAAILLLDIDHFKPINDKFGHDAGDEVLKEFARRIARNTRGLDLACRYGGEEFVVAMPDTDLNFAQMVAERLREDIADEPFPLSDGRTIDITVSIGVAVMDGRRDEDTPQAVIKRADEALYDAKNGGRNKVVCQAA
ncbi:MAG: PleD family two-component system response regulator [Parvularculaceae bacterium]